VDQPALIRICAADALADGGAGVRFRVAFGGLAATAFVVRYRGRIFGYLNRCAHVAMELDWLEGAFFDADGEWLMCSTHGALYDPKTGHCVGGACLGHGGLRVLDVVELERSVYWRPDAGVLPIEPAPLD
jgi:nitrite reductase/ring-hydroxylating ferredoxin subunit